MNFNRKIVTLKLSRRTRVSWSIKTMLALEYTIVKDCAVSIDSHVVKG